jgi:hypothetical protein
MLSRERERRLGLIALALQPVLGFERSQGDAE